jgi:hypothetical protein
MEVDQKHITMIRMHDAKGCEISLARKGEDYQLQLSSSNNVVNIVLGYNDVRRLCQQLVQLDVEENWKAHYVPPPAPEFKSFFFNGGGPRQYQDTMSTWYNRMANEMAGDRAEKR